MKFQIINKIKVLFFFIASIFLYRCAQYVPPTGGKKDEIPPKLIKSTPENQTLNFKEKEFELFFDELIDVTSLRQELLVVPELDGTFEIKSKAKSVSLKFEKPFKVNTTYTFNFRKGIKDLTERNEAKNLKFVFSTGKEIDSLKIDGNVKNLFTNQPIFEAMVALYEINDSLNFKKNKPSYFTKTDSSGNYNFENIKSSKYRIIAFVDKNNNLRFDPKNEIIDFKKDTFKLVKNISSLNFLLYPANSDKPKNQKTLQRVEDFTVIYDKNLKSAEIRFENPKDSIPYSLVRNEIRFYNFPQKVDTLRINISVKDSAENTYSHLQKIKFRESDKKRKEKREVFSLDINPKVNEDVEKLLKYEINFDTPIEKIDLEKIKILSDTIKLENIENKNFEWNQFRTQLKIKKEVTAQREVRTVFEKGAFVNIKSDSSSKLILSNPILKTENYGIIDGQIDGFEKENKIIQLVNENYKVVAEKFVVDKFSFNNIKPGVYLIRTIIDFNKNKQWDFGNLDKETLPEPIFFNEEPIRMKANFEVSGLIVRVGGK